MMQEIVMLLAVNMVIFTGLFGAVWLVKNMFGKRLNAKLQYLLWGVLVLKLLIPFSIAAQWSPFLFAQPADLSMPAVREQADINDETTASLPLQNMNLQFNPIVSETQAAQNDTAEEPQNVRATPQSMQGLKPVHVDWMMLIVFTWIGGALVCFIRFSFKSRQLKKTVIRSQTGAAPDWLHSMLEKCKEDLGISRRICIAIQSGLPVPAIMGVFRPVLMVPEGLVKEKNMERVQHVLMHELTHCKRHDLAALWLLNTLCAVYWFNPLVWLCGKLICRDMEAACDGMVVKKIGISQRQRYIETILHFSGKNEFAHSLAAMSLNDGCMKMRIRIRSMYLKKTTKRTKIMVLALALLMLFSAFTAGCQPTPEKVIVQSKNNDSVAQAIAQSSGEAAEIHTYSAPATWQDEAHDDDKSINITIDADVIVPVDKWGIYELVPQSTTKEDVQKMLKAIVGDAPVYGELTLQSKDELIEEIAGYKAQKANFEEMYDNYDANHNGDNDTNSASSNTYDSIMSELTKDEIQQNIVIVSQMISNAEAKLQLAPDESTIVRNPFSIDVMFDKDTTIEQATENGMTLTTMGTDRSISVHGKAELGRETPADIDIYYGYGSFGEGLSISFIDYDDNEQCFSSSREYTGQALFKCSIGADEAAALARDKMKELGFDYLDIAKTQVNNLLDRKRMEGDKLPECFEFTFTRALNGAMTTFAKGGKTMTMEDMKNAQYAPRWQPDEAVVYVDDSGIIGVKINARKSDVNRQAYGIELKNFADIMDIFKQQVFIDNAYGGPGSPDQVTHMEIHINEIRLGYMPVPWKNHEGQMIFTPVWDFFGDEVITYKDGIGGDLGEALDENNELAMDLGINTLLTINALDGSIINRQLGY